MPIKRSPTARRAMLVDTVAFTSASENKIRERSYMSSRKRFMLRKLVWMTHNRQHFDEQTYCRLFGGGAWPEKFTGFVLA